MKTMNLQHEYAYHFFNRIFFLYLSKKNPQHSKKFKLSSLERTSFLLAIQLLSYFISNPSTNLKVENFLNRWNPTLKNNSIQVTLDSMEIQGFLTAIHLLSYGLWSISLLVQSEKKPIVQPSRCYSSLQNNLVIETVAQKIKNNFQFLFQLKQFLLKISQDASNFWDRGEMQPNLRKKKRPKLYYTYRLTFQEPGNREKKYYMGYRGYTTHPLFDQYDSSSKIIKELKKKYGSNCLNKKILGIYATEQEALYNEVHYHKTLNVDKHPLFFNQARQTTTAFFYHNTGRIQSPESNQRRSMALVGRNRFTEEGLVALVNYQLHRERSNVQREELRQRALSTNAKKVICPFCGKEGQLTAMRRWHFANCKKSPNPSIKSIEQREKLRQRIINLNTGQRKKDD